MPVCVIAGGSEAGAGGEVEEWNESSSSTEQENLGTELFWLDYTADSGHVTSFLVYKAGTRSPVVCLMRGGMERKHFELKHC